MDWGRSGSSADGCKGVRLLGEGKKEGKVGISWWETPFPILALLVLVVVLVYWGERRAGALFGGGEVVVDVRSQVVGDEEGIPEGSEGWVSGLGLPELYRSLVVRGSWDRLLAVVRRDTGLSERVRWNLLVLAFARLGQWDSVLGIVERGGFDPSEVLVGEVCLDYAFALYRWDSVRGREGLWRCLSGRADQRLYLRAAAFLVEHFESEEARAVLRAMQRFVTLRYRAYWHYWMGLTHAIDGLRDSALAHLARAIEYKPDWIKPRMKIVELLPNTEEGLDRKEKLLREVIRLKPMYASAHYMLAVVRQRRGGAMGLVDSLGLFGVMHPEVLMERVRAELAVGNYGLARRYLDRLVAVMPENPRVLFLVGNWYLAVDSLGEARGWYWRALRRARYRYPEAWLNLGITYRRLGRVDSAIWAYRQALRYRGDYHEALFNLAVAYWHADSLAEAYRLFRRLARAVPNHDRTWYFLGRVYERMGEEGRAIEAYRRALQLRMDYRLALLRLARLDTSGVVGGMLAEYLRRHPEDVKVLRAWGDWLLGRGRVREALRVYRRVLELDPDNVGVLRRLARLYFRLGDWEASYRYWSEVVDRQPDNLVARSYLVRAALRLGDTVQAVKHLERMLALSSARIRTWDRLIGLYRVKGWWRRGVRVLVRHWREDLPESARLAYEIATFARKSRQFGVARRFYGFALDGGYRVHWSAFWLGRLWLNEGDTMRALRYFRLAVSLKEDFGLAWKRLAQLYWLVDSLDRARWALVRARALRPEDSDLADLERKIQNVVP